MAPKVTAYQPQQLSTGLKQRNVSQQKKYNFFPELTTDTSRTSDTAKTYSNPIVDWFKTTFGGRNSEEALALWNNAESSLAPNVVTATQRRMEAFMNLSDGDRNILEALG